MNGTNGVVRAINSQVRIVALSFVFALLVSACGGGGGGGGDGSAATPLPTAKLAGAVSGTTVIAIDADGNFLDSDSTAGKAPDLDLDRDGAAESFSFLLNNLPLNKKFRVFLISRGGVYPMYFDSNSDGSSDSNVFSLSAEKTLNLGFVDVGTFEEGRAIPSNKPSTASGFRLAGADLAIPMALNSPPTDGLSINQLIDAGLTAMGDGWLLGAKTYFEAAVSKASVSSRSDADAARFLLALTRFIAWGVDTPSDGNAANLNRVGDALDKLGIPDNETRGDLRRLRIDSPLPAGSPTSGDAQVILSNVMRAEIDASINQLDAISVAFDQKWIDPLGSGRTVESDYGDVLILRGAFKAIAGVLDFQRAYNLDADIDAWIADATLTTDSFLVANPNVLSLAQVARLAIAKAEFVAAVEDMRAAIDSIEGEADPQSDDLFSLAASELTRSKASLDEIQAALMSSSVTTSGASPVTLNLAQIFDVGVDFRKPTPGLLPPFSGDSVSGLFPDPSFSGAVSGFLNDDINPADGVPDILQ